MAHATSAREWRGTDYQGEVRQHKIDLNHSTTSGISRAGPALKTLIVCIIQVKALPSRSRGSFDQEVLNSDPEDNSVDDSHAAYRNQGRVEPIVVVDDVL